MFFTFPSQFPPVDSFCWSKNPECCIHELLPDGRAIPFCAYNSLGYREKVKRELTSK